MTYVPDTSDIVWISLDPQVGREQAGRRPFLVLTPRSYNVKTSLFVGCPITSRCKGYPFEVPLSGSAAISGVVLSDQVRSLDWRGRNVEYIERASRMTRDATRARIAVLLELGQ